MKDPAKNKKVESYTLDPDVIATVDRFADRLGISSSSLVNMQLRIALGIVDEATSNFMNRGDNTGTRTSLFIASTPN